MTAPPDRIARYDLDGNNGLMPSALGRLVEYRDHLTAIAAAEGRGRDETLWDAVAVLEHRASEILRDPAMNNATGAARYDQATLCAELLRDMLPEDAPAPPQDAQE